MTHRSITASFLPRRALGVAGLGVPASTTTMTTIGTTIPMVRTGVSS